MPLNRRDVAFPTVLAWFLSGAAPFVVSIALLHRACDMRRPDKLESASHIHLPTGVMDARDGVLFTLQTVPGLKGLRIEGSKLKPLGSTGNAVSLLEGSQIVLVGRYFYRFTFAPPQLNWEMVGIRIRINETVGRNPGFQRKSSLTYEPKLESGKDLAAWLDGMPSRAFTIRRLADCGPGSFSSCLEFHNPAHRITIERTVPSKFHHVQAGERVGVEATDRLWIASFPYRLIRNADLDVDLVLTEDYETVHGDRKSLGPPGLSGTADLGGDNSFQVEDITAQFREGHLNDKRWDPETEDEYQLLVDSGLLCLGYLLDDDRVVPQIHWADIATGECRDPLGFALPQPPAGVSRALADLYVRRRRSDHLVRSANERLKQLSTVNPKDFPFIFEWWPVSTSSGLVRFPVTIWGTRTGSTNRDLTQHPSGAAVVDHPVLPTVILKDRNGNETVLSRSIGRERVYATGTSMLGLGPLIGIRGSVDGLDQVIPTRSGSQPQLVLTIDPDLQSALWTRLKSKLGKFGTDPPTLKQSVEFGISGIVLDAENGDILSVLNWPAGLVWEEAEAHKKLRAGGNWGVPQSSMNGAMLRADKVGSVFKIMAIYSMADLGVLDGKVETTGVSCNKLPFGTLETRNGRVKPIKSFKDNQMGPLPTGSAGLLGGLNAATAASCNTYFALAATMLLDSHPPEVTHTGTCPVDTSLRRTDTGKLSSRQWLLCTSSWIGPGGRQRKGSNTHWLLLPESENLAERSRRAFRESTHGYFERTLQAGYRLGYPDRIGRLRGHLRPSYENAAYRNDWMPGLPLAEGHVFVYPMMFSPGSHFGGDPETWGGVAIDNKAAGLTWREFAAQAIGEAGQGSALSVATMYSAAGREDGAIPAPRLVRSESVTVRSIFEPQGQRVARVRQALSQPMSAHGTARAVGAFLKQNHIEGVLGKTGTFTVEANASPPTNNDLEAPDSNIETHIDARRLSACGIATDNSLVSGQKPSILWLGSDLCEKGQLMVTGVHRYPESPAIAPHSHAGEPRNGGSGKESTHTTFAAVLLPQNPREHAIIVAIIVDLDEYSGERINARQIVAPMIEEISRWRRK